MQLTCWRRGANLDNQSMSLNKDNILRAVQVFSSRDPYYKKEQVHVLRLVDFSLGQQRQELHVPFVRE